MPSARDADVAGARVDHDIHHRDELPGRDLADHYVVGGLQEVPWVGVVSCKRTEHELRHGHVGRRLDAVTGDVAERDGKATVGKLHEVVDVPAHLDMRRRLVRGAELEPGHLRDRLGQQRALHRVGELLLLLVEAGVVDRERRLSGDAHRLVDRLLRDGRAGAHRDDLERREHL
jgi:hypothetical protein